MKAAALFLAMTFLVPIAASAENACEVISRLARQVMTGRQNGVPLTDMMTGAEQGDAKVADLTRAIILAAYEVPRYNTERIKQQEITDFENTVALQCYKSMS